MSIQKLDAARPSATIEGWYGDKVLEVIRETRAKINEIIDFLNQQGD